MKVKDLFIPRSKLGKVSLLSILAVIVFYILSRVIKISSGPRESPSFFSDPVSASLLIIAGLCGVSAFIIGTTAIIKSKDRAIPVFIVSLIGLFILVFWLGEILSPH